jgi:D-alanyl-D-alanine carboxypeptidase
MKQFFTVLFGGLSVIGGSFLLAYGAGIGWRALSTVSWPTPTALFAAITNAMPQPTDGTSFLGMARMIRYTADQEEDFVNKATVDLLKSDHGPITANNYIIKDLTTGKTVAEHNSETLVPIASLTKLVTAAVARKLIDPGEHIAISRDIINIFGNTGQFKSGEVFRAEDIYYPLLMVSSNDAAEALAQDYGRKQFIEAMNNFTQSIGAYGTYFVDPSGLSPLNKSTAKDITIIMNWIRTNDPHIIDITTTKSKTIGSHVWDNPTHFLNWSNYLGGKNGYIPESNRTGAALFRLGAGSLKDVYAIVVLGSSYRDGDVVKLISKVK